MHNSGRTCNYQWCLYMLLILDHINSQTPLVFHVVANTAIDWVCQMLYIFYPSRLYNISQRYFYIELVIIPQPFQNSLPKMLYRYIIIDMLFVFYICCWHYYASHNIFTLQVILANLSIYYLYLQVLQENPALLNLPDPEAEKMIITDQMIAQVRMVTWHMIHDGGTIIRLPTIMQINWKLQTNSTYIQHNLNSLIGKL